MHWRALGFHGSWVAQFKRPERKVQIVACHITQNALAKIPPMPPVLGMIFGVVRPGGGRPQPKIPVDLWRNQGSVSRPFAVGQAFLAPNMAFFDLTNRSG